MKAEISRDGGISPRQLAAQARAAYDQKRIKDCIGLIKALLAADPEDVEAKALQSAIQSDIQRDLVDAQLLLEDSRTKDDGQKYRKAAEIILLKTLNLDPGNEEAKALLATAKSFSAPPPSPAPVVTMARPIEEEKLPAPPMPTPEPPPPPPQYFHPEPPPPEPPPQPPQPNFVLLSRATVSSEAILRTPPREDYFTASPRPKKPEPASSGRLPVIAFIVVAAIGLLFLAQSYVKDLEFVSKPEAVPPRPEMPNPPTAQQLVAQPETPKPAPLPAPAATTATTAPLNAVEPAKPPEPVAPPTGTLAVSSLVAADIYQNNKYLGSTPTTLQLPLGRQTLEYRHGDLRTTLTHNIKAKEATTALVTFETVVQINARPWAQVFVEGTTRRPLGQTPLSDIRVPIGSVLTFENPNFSAKTHRVSGNQPAIQVVFP